MSDIESPCVRECALEKGVCTACGRTREEIVNWSNLSKERRQEVINRLE